MAKTAETRLVSGRLLLSPEQVAQELQVSAHTVYRMLQGGRLPGGKVGGQWRVPTDKLDRWIDDRCWFDGRKEAA